MAEDSEVRQRILEAGRGLFFKHGISKVTMDEIAAQLGISKKTLYKHFPGKEELLEAATRSHLEEIDARLRDIYTDASTDILEKLKRMTAFCTSLYGQMTTPLLEDLQKSAPGLWNDVAEHRRCNIRTDFGNLIRQGREQGIFRNDIDDTLFITIYLTVIENILNPDSLAQLPFTPSQAFDACVKILYEGFFTQEGRDRYYADK